MALDNACDECPRTFANKRNLSDHKLTHSGDKRSAVQEVLSSEESFEDALPGSHWRETTQVQLFNQSFSSFEKTQDETHWR